MKQKLLFILLLMASAIDVCASEPLASLIVELKNGSKTTFFLKDKPLVKFEGTNLKVTSTAGDVTFLLADVKTFTYEKKDASGTS